MLKQVQHDGVLGFVFLTVILSLVQDLLVMKPNFCSTETDAKIILALRFFSQRHLGLVSRSFGFGKRSLFEFTKPIISEPLNS